MGEKDLSKYEVDLNRVSELAQKINKAAAGYNQGEIALAFSAFVASQAIDLGKKLEEAKN